MKRQNYWIDLMPRKGEEVSAKRRELALRKFLFNTCNIVRFTVFDYGQLFPPRKVGGEQDPKFKAFAKIIQKDFKKREVKKGKFLFFNTQRIYYFYKLSSQMKQLINKRGLFYWNLTKEGGDFYCLMDATFYRGKQQIAEILSFDHEISLHLTNAGKTKLEKQGLKLQAIPNNPRP